uniref:Uncharacterized protein n=1 Tax=Nelumbo nucifera TaxID=4432 RepID=A0A822XQB5_NELNU|nr:TPA_asm: hypothetical protein HUJ06_022814 [Nelumbo nucifera]
MQLVSKQRNIFQPIKFCDVPRLVGNLETLKSLNKPPTNNKTPKTATSSAGKKSTERPGRENYLAFLVVFSQQIPTKKQECKSNIHG